MQSATKRETAQEMQLVFRDLEYALINALVSGEEHEGVIGRQAGRALQRVPSVVYWGALKAWGIIAPEVGSRQYFERVVLRREERSRTPAADDPEFRIELTPTGLDHELPPIPDQLHRTTTFALTPVEATYLSETITRHQPKSLFAHLINHRPASWDLEHPPVRLWEQQMLDDLPQELTDLTARAERFSFYISGADLLYDLLAAEQVESDDASSSSSTANTCPSGRRQQHSPRH